jgi:hypothetical protein
LKNLRRQEYWSMLSGATGQLYGSAFTWRFPPDWQTRLDTPGVLQLSYMKQLFVTRRWYDLVPDQKHTVVTAGYGKFFTRWHFLTDPYVTAARTPDGTLLLAYVPAERTITVAMNRFAGKVTALWYDPTNGTYKAASAAPLANTGTRDFTSPGRNSAGAYDWVAVLSSNSTRTDMPVGH